MLTLALTSTMAQQTVQQSADYVPAKENLEARKHFQDEKFGIFLHWGLYAMVSPAIAALYTSYDVSLSVAISLREVASDDSSNMAIAVRTTPVAEQ